MDRSTSNEADSLGLRFDSHYDAVNYARKVVADARNWLAIDKLNIAECYEKGVIVIHCEFGINGSLDKYHLVFGAIPAGRIWETEIASTLPFSGHAVLRHPDRPDDSVLIGITKLVQGPEKIVPSFVWLERAHHVENFLRGVFSQTVKGHVEVGALGSNREERVISGSLIERSDGTDRLIESGSKIINCVDDVTIECQWHRFSQLELEELVSTV